MSNKVTIEIELEPGPISAEKLSGAKGPIKLSVLYSSRVDLSQPALQTELLMQVDEIIRDDNPDYCYGQFELAGVTHSFTYSVLNNEISLFVYEGNFNADTNPPDIGPGGYAGYIAWLTPWLRQAAPKQ
jgi:hypothetical protein